MLSVNMKIPKEFRSLPEGDVERSETEGVKIDFIKLCKNSPRHFFYKKNACPLEDGAEVLRRFDKKCRQPQGLSLRRYTN